jgi:hypothetical protein
MGLMGELLAQPPWLLAWVNWMGVVNLASLAFLRRTEARWTITAFAASFATMNLLYAVVGYERLLGLAHVLFWTPLLIFVAPRLQRHGSDSAYGLWLRILVATNGLSLVVDYADVIRWFAGRIG